MAGTNAVAGTLKVIELLTAAFQDQSTVTVEYAANAKTMPNEYVYGGRIAGPHDPSTFRGAGRRSRAEVLTWNLYGQVSQPGAKPEETATRAVEIGQVIEETLAAGDVQDGAGVPGLKTIEIVSFAMESSRDDDRSTTQFVYTIQFKSILT